MTKVVWTMDRRTYTVYYENNVVQKVTVSFPVRTLELRPGDNRPKTRTLVCKPGSRRYQQAVRATKRISQEKNS